MRKFLLPIFYLLSLALLTNAANLLIHNSSSFAVSHFNIFFFIFFIVYLSKLNIHPTALNIVLGLSSDLFLSQSFGVFTIAFVVGCIFFLWMLNNIFTTYSLVVIFFTAFTTMAISRVLYILILYLQSTLFHKILPDMVFSIQQFLWEALITAGTLTATYYLSKKIFKNIRTEYILSSKNRYL